MSSNLYSSQSAKKYQDLTGGVLGDPRLWLPDRSCPRLKGYSCRNPECVWHGQATRNFQNAQALNFNLYYYILQYTTLETNAYLLPSQLRTLIKQFTAQFTRLNHLPYIYNTEWKDNTPHLHFIFRHTKYEKPNIHIKPIWADALTTIGHPFPNTPKVSTQEVKVGDEEHAISYIFKTGWKKRPSNECKPLLLIGDIKYSWGVLKRMHPRWQEPYIID